MLTDRIIFTISISIALWIGDSWEVAVRAFGVGMFIAIIGHLLEKNLPKW
jgi:hypothetical protein